MGSNKESIEQFGTRAPGVITDPGDAGAIEASGSGCVPIISAGAETRTLASPSRLGQEITLYFQTDGGNVVVTAADEINVTGNNTITLTTVDESITFRSVWIGDGFQWRVAWNDLNGADNGGTSDIGIGLSTV